MANESQEAINRGIAQKLRQYPREMLPIEYRKAFLKEDLQIPKIEKGEKKLEKYYQGKTPSGRRELAREKFLRKAEEKRFGQRYSFKKQPSLKKGWGSGVSKIGKGLMAAFMPSEQQLQPVSASSGGYSGRGRGRPMQTYSPKMLPDGTVVRMPVQAYKRLVSAQRAQMRFQAELARTRASMQPPPDHVRGYGGQAVMDETDRFLAEDSMADQMAQQQFAQQTMQPQQMPQQQGRRFTAASFVAGARNLLGGPQQPSGRISLMGSAGQQPGSRITLLGGQQRNPDLWDIWGNTGPKILAAQNIFNRPRADGKFPLASS